jgi:hypothetical protein
MNSEPLSYSPDAVNSVLNQLALIVSYSNLVIGDLEQSDPRRADLLEIRRFAFKAAGLLGRP